MFKDKLVSFPNSTFQLAGNESLQKLSLIGNSFEFPEFKNIFLKLKCLNNFNNVDGRNKLLLAEKKSPSKTKFGYIQTFNPIYNGGCSDHMDLAATMWLLTSKFVSNFQSIFLYLLSELQSRCK